jgi:putative ABC transport system ATP-binding protein
MDRPTAGTLVVGDVAVHSASSRVLRHLRRRTVGYVFQRASDNFFPYLTVDDHLRVAVRASGAPTQIPPSELLDVLEIAHRADHLPSELSGGEQARAAVAEVLAGGAAVVVADEPTAELDTASAASVLRCLEALVDRGVTFVLATHDAAVMRRADDVLELDHGVLRDKLARRSGPSFLETLSRPPVPAGRAPDERRSKTVAELRGVGKSYRRGAEVVHAVRDANLTLRAGELVGLIGRSGSGKTTLLNIAAGWERADEGQVVVAGKDPSRFLPAWSEVAVLPQRLGLIDELTIRENIEYPARLAGTLEGVRWLVDGLIESLELSDLQIRYPRETSVGEQQRAALARALVLSPRLLLADEPTGHQYRASAEAVFDALRQAVKAGTACLAATHNEDVVGYLDRILSISDGRVVERTA